MRYCCHIWSGASQYPFIPLHFSRPLFCPFPIRPSPSFSLFYDFFFYNFAIYTSIDPREWIARLSIMEYRFSKNNSMPPSGSFFFYAGKETNEYFSRLLTHKSKTNEQLIGFTLCLAQQLPSLSLSLSPRLIYFSVKPY